MPASARILVVDDEELIRKALCETLQLEGHVAVGCQSGPEALEHLRRPGSGFDLILTDLMMPGMDGITLLRHACQHDPLLVAVMMTGVGTVATAVEAMQAGALDYILKPFRLFDAMPVITRALAVRALRVQNRALERQVREHAAELELKNQELEAFSYSVSHDLRAPLRRIEQFSERLASEHGTRFDPAARHLLERIGANTALMSKLIDDLLQLSQVTQGPLTITEVDLSAEAQAVIDTLRAQEPERMVSVRIAPDLTWRADPGLTRIVLDNLIGNAWKYTARTPAAVIEIDRMPSHPETWYIRDNGVGFDMVRADRLFRPFQRLNPQGEFPGTGIGLSLVARIIARHHGTIRAEGAPGRGATFFISPGPTPEPSGPIATRASGLTASPPAI
jgi:signal transduction histidine kinase